jgi:hypothetical protein
LKLLRAVASVARLYALEKFSLKEIIGYALYVPKIRQDIPVLISKERSLGKLATRNPPALQNRTEDKMVFYEVCRAANLPIPANYGIFRNGRGVDADKNTLNARGGDGYPSSTPSCRHILSSRMFPAFMDPDSQPSNV